MTKIPAAYFDGSSARRVRVELTFDDEGQVRVDGDGVHRAWPDADVEIGPRLANTPRIVHFPDGGKCETEDNDALDQIVARRGGYSAQSWLHRIESHWPHVTLAVAVAIGTAWLTLEFVLPWAAVRAVHAIPPSMESEMGEEGLRTLDRILFEPTELPAPEQSRVRALFDSMSHQLRRARPASGADARALALPARLVLRSSPRVGANAFTLPGGIVVLTDELVQLAADEDELLGVMAHEMGHHAHRHVLRGLLQSSMTALFLAVAFGDLSSVTGLSATLPTYLVDAKYSRRFELEADRFAAEYLDATGRSRMALARILERLGEANGADEVSSLDYLSSHPATPERIDALMPP